MWATWGHVGVRRLFCSWSNAILSGLGCHTGHGDIWTWATARDYEWVCGPSTARVCVDVIGLFGHQRSQGCPGSRLTPVVMLISEGHAAAGAMPVWVACIATRVRVSFGSYLLPTTMSEVTSRPGLLPGTMSGSMVPPQLGSVLKPVAPFTTKGYAAAWDLGHHVGS